MQELLHELRAYLEWARDAGLQNVAAPERKPEPAAMLGLGPAMKLPTLEEVREEMGECTRCKLHKGRHNIVFGVGIPRRG